LIAKKVVAV